MRPYSIYLGHKRGSYIGTLRPKYLLKATWSLSLRVRGLGLGLSALTEHVKRSRAAVGKLAKHAECL